MIRIIGGSKFLLVAVLLSTLVACSKTMVQAPNLYSAENHPFAMNTEKTASAGVDVIFATDRVPTGDKDPAKSFGYERSVSLAVGTARVVFGDSTSWEQLVSHSTGEHHRNLVLDIESADEAFRFPAATAYSLDDKDREMQAQNAELELHAMVEAYLDKAGGDEAYVYVHGYNNKFPDGLFAMSQIWHYLGRSGVPIAYSWPAGRGTARGYAYDRESGEFTNYHLKEFLRALASSDRLNQIHLISHSRGTDVLTTALRELAIEARCDGRRLSESLKLGHLVLAAPDLDFEVISQRLGAEGLHLEAEHTTVYVNADDKALGMSSILFLGKTRLGRTDEEDWSPEQIAMLARWRDRLAFVESKTKTSFIGHGYFYSNPAVLSDLILLLRDDAWVDDTKRPLEPTEHGFWIIRDGYPQTSKADLPK
jgi:esterase/lipase superfamily enzyme